MPLDKYYLVYWEEEDSVTVVGASAVQHVRVGEREVVKIGREQFSSHIILCLYVKLQTRAPLPRITEISHWRRVKLLSWLQMEP